jgi:hypothetical protein
MICPPSASTAGLAERGTDGRGDFDVAHRFGVEVYPRSKARARKSQAVAAVIAAPARGEDAAAGDLCDDRSRRIENGRAANVRRVTRRLQTRGRGRRTCGSRAGLRCVPSGLSPSGTAAGVEAQPAY